MTEQPPAATCPHCRAHFDDAGIERGVCPLCGKSLAAHFDQTLAADDGQLDQIIETLDSTPVIPDRTAEIGTDDGRLFDRTLEVGPSAEPEAVNDPAGADQVGASQQHEAAAPAGADAATIEQSIPPDAGPTAADFGAAEPPSPGFDRQAATVDGQSGRQAGHAGADAAGAFGPTVEVDPFAPLDDAQMTQMWAPSISPVAKPTTSLKLPTNMPTASGRTTSISATNLVIQTRAFAGRRDQATGPSGAGPDYEVLDLLGEGGMGVVYAARQGSIDRTVAIKMLKGDAVQDERLRGKFLVEAVVTGDLEHPNIVPIYDLGENEAGALFYSMKRVVGTPWDDVIKSNSLAENLEILMKVADAIAFAHSRGVVHRDLKPDNVMLGGFGEVLVMDWGLALTEDNRATAGMGGTPAYMAPEMAGGPMRDVGPASDIYLLGAILYEIVTGRRPHTGKTVMDCLKGAADNVIQPTDKSGELVNIARKAMATRIADRYQTVGDLQASIRDYQSHAESIVLASRAAEDLAKAEEAADYQLYSRALFAFQEAVALWPGNEQARSGVDQVKRSYAATALDKADYDLGLSLLDRGNPQHEPLYVKLDEARRERDARQRRLKTAKRVGVALVAAILLIVTGAAFWINHEKGVAEDSRDKAVAAEQKERKAKIAAVAAQDSERVAKEAAVAAKDKERIARVAAETAKEEERIAKEDAVAAQEKERIAKEDAVAAQERERVAKEDAVAAKEQEAYAAYLARIGLAVESIERNAFDKARQLLAECPKDLRNWEWQRLNHLCSLDEREFRHDEPLETVAYAPDGKRFACGGWDGKVRIWDVENPDVAKVEIPASSGYVFAVAFSPNGQWLAAGTNERGAGDGRGEYLKLWDAETGRQVATYRGHTDAVVSVVFSGDGRRLLTASYDGTARLWDVATPERPAATFQGHDDGKPVRWAKFSPDERRIVTASDDGSAIVWSAATAEQLARFREHTGPVYAAVFSPDGERVVSGGQDGRLLIWDPDTVKPYDLQTLTLQRNNPPQPYDALPGHSGPVRAIAFSPPSKDPGEVPIQRRIVSGGDDNTIRVWYAGRVGDADSHAPLKTLRGHGGPVRACCFSPDGTRVISASYDAQVKTWNIDDYHEQIVLRGHRDTVFSASYDSKGQRIVTASRDRTARLWHAATGRGADFPVLQEGHEFLATSAVFFPNGNRVVTAAADNTARVWNTATGAEVLRLTGTGGAAAVTVSHDGRLILTGSGQSAKGDYTAILWDAANGEPLQSLGAHTYEVTAVAFSNDDRLILTGDYSGRCQLWDREADAELWSARNHTRKITAAIFTPDGRRVLTASTDNTVAQWDVKAGTEIGSLLLKHPDAVTAMATAPDDRRVLTACADGVARWWDADRAVVLRQWRPEDEMFNAVAVSPTGKRAATIGEATSKGVDNKTGRIGSRIRLWNLDSGSEVTFGGTGGQRRPLVESIGEDLSYWSATFSPDGESLLALRGGEAESWDLDTGLARGALGSHGAVSWAAFSPDGERIVTASWDGTARIWNSRTGAVERKLEDGHSDRLHSSDFSPDGRLVLTSGDDATAVIWSAETGRVVRTLKGHTGPIRRAVFSPDGALVATASADRTARIWEVDSGRQIEVLSGHQQAVLSVAFSSHDPQLVVTASEDNTALVWDITKPETPLLVLQGHSAIVTSAAFSPDGRRVVTGSEDTTAKIWDARTGSEAATAKTRDAPKAKEIMTLKGHTAPITSVVFSPDGSQILTASRDATAIVWPAAP